MGVMTWTVRLLRGYYKPFVMYVLCFLSSILLLLHMYINAT